MNQTKLYCLAFLALASAALFISSTLVAAQNKARLTVGDRVENVQVGSEKGTVVAVEEDALSDCYLILFDYQKGTGAKGNRVCTYGNTHILFLLDKNDKRVRDANVPVKTAQPETPPVENRDKQNVAPKADDKNKPVTEAPSQCGGELLLKPKTKGRAASAALFKDVIKALWDKEADPGKYGKRVTTITSLTVGAAYQWRPLIDFQSLGTKPKTVYPVQAKYLTCTEGLLEWKLVESTSEEIYSCYIEEEFGEWTCAIRKAGAFKNSYVDKSEKKKITGQ
jgi:hypothetical protein